MMQVDRKIRLEAGAASLGASRGREYHQESLTHPFFIPMLSLRGFMTVLATLLITLACYN